MKYKITIEKIEEKEVVKNVWVSPVDENDKGGYADKVVKEDVNTDIYEQITDSEINLMAVIKAFNGEK